MCFTRQRRALAVAAAIGALLVLVTAAGAVQTARTARNGRIAWKAFLDSSLRTSAIFAANPDGSHRVQLTHPERGVTDDLPDWSPDAADDLRGSRARVVARREPHRLHADQRHDRPDRPTGSVHRLEHRRHAAQDHPLASRWRRWQLVAGRASNRLPVVPRLPLRRDLAGIRRQPGWKASREAHRPRSQHRTELVAGRSSDHLRPRAGRRLPPVRGRLAHARDRRRRQASGTSHPHESLGERTGLGHGITGALTPGAGGRSQ
jgi:hypothetical protein